MKLNQVLAIEKGVKARVKADLTEAYQLCAKPDLFSGFNKTYEKINDDGEDLPSEQKRVQFKAEELLSGITRVVSEMLDVQASMDWANTVARADVKVGDQVVLEKVPVTYLLFMEHQLTDMRTFIGKLPELDEMEDWTLDPQGGVYKSKETKTHRNKKVVKPIVKIAPTKEHPGQAELVSEDILVGHWNQVKQSGGMVKARKALLVDRVENLLKAVKFAKEEANSVDADKKSVGAELFKFILA